MISLLKVTRIDLLGPIRNQLEAIEISRPEVAKLLCTLIPARCPFEREIKLRDRTLIRIPPLCKLNPFYDQLVSLRFKSLLFLEEQGHEDIMRYC
ncbi:MAG TPA: Mo-dependent nitrogenase C-terminal domain-containing protein [Allocoleopsis sp.]